MNTDTSPSEEIENKSAAPSRTFPRVFLRILLVLVVGCAIGAAVYFSAVGWIPYLDQRLFEPIEKNRVQIQVASATQDALINQLATMREDLDENQALTSQDLEAALTSADFQVGDVQAAVETVNAYSLTQVPALLGTITANQQKNESHISALATAQQTYLGNGFENELMKILALLSRSNQFLLHNNYGLAEDQLVAAQQILLDMEEDLNDWQHMQAVELLSALESAIANLPDQPVVASVQLELAWQLTIRGFQALPSQTFQEAPTPTPGGTSTPTPSP